jgi:hypothetical protein
MRAAAVAALLILATASTASAQVVSYRGFAEARGFWFPQDAPTDRQNLIVDVIAREEIFVRPLDWLQLGGGVDFRANTGDQVAESWQPDFADRGVQRAPLSVRRLVATATRGPVTIDAGKQFIRWGKTDIVTPTDRFAPRDYVNVIDNEFLAVRGLRGVAAFSEHSFDFVWVPVVTPSRIPLPSKRWTVVPSDAPALEAVDRPMTDGQQVGFRWGYTASRYELSVSVFDGFNHLPIVEMVGPLSIALRLPTMRMYGADSAVPTRWFTLKGEVAYYTTSTPSADEYVLYVVQLERQQGEWQLIGGYAGEVVTKEQAVGRFAPDRGMTKSLIGRVSYTIDASRSAGVETAVRENLDGVYVKAEYSRAYGDHWRATATIAVIAGREDDFLGQYRRNSHAILGVRYSF